MMHSTILWQTIDCERKREKNLFESDQWPAENFLRTNYVHLKRKLIIQSANIRPQQLELHILPLIYLFSIIESPALPAAVYEL